MAILLVKEGANRTKITRHGDFQKVIRSILDDHGNLLDSQDLIASEAIRFFEGLLGSTDDVVRSCSVALLREMLGATFSDDCFREELLGRRLRALCLS
ncbi:hypothetical protein V6N13_053815 [Hibiscus sabdariffa]